MAHFGEQPKPKFEIQPIIEQKPFEDPGVQSFFVEWCKINDDIQPEFVPREQWDSLGMQGILKKRPDGTRILFIPKDLKLWEMVGVIEVVDRDTFAAKPEKAIGAKERIRALGRTFENAGIYIAKRLDGIERGRAIAEALALEFYQYGQSLTQGKAQEIPEVDEIASGDLTPEETEVIDRFLAGDTLYESRKQRIEKLAAKDQAKKDELLEKERRKTLAQFFRVAEKAFTLEKKTAEGKLRKSPTKLKPWQSDAPIHSAFLRRIERALTQQIETPKREFEMAIFRRGLVKLVNEMRETIDMRDQRTGEVTPGWKRALNKFLTNVGFDPIVEQRKLVDILHIAELKAELETIRQTGDLVKVSVKEREIADKIQKAVSSFPYQPFKGDQPSEIVAKQYINCVGASTLGGALFKEAGLNYLIGDVPGHSILFLVTSDGKVEWRDMLNPFLNEYLTDEMIKGQRKDGKPLTVNDIVAFSQKPSPEGLIFDIDSPKYRKKLRWIKEGQRQYVAVFEPEYGQRIQILSNTGLALYYLDRHEEAVEAFRQATALNPKDASLYNNLGNALSLLGRHKEAIEAYRQAIAINSKYAYPYYGLGEVFYSLDRHEEAVEAYSKFIDLADPERDKYWVERAKQRIAKLKS